MKRLIVFILIIILLCGINFSITKDLNLDKIFPNAQVELFTDSKTGINVQKIDNGQGEIIFCTTNELSYILSQVSSAVGFTIKIQNASMVSVLKSFGINFSFVENYGVYGWSNYIYNNFNIKNKSIEMLSGRVNFQAVEENGAVLLGIPIILGSY